MTATPPQSDAARASAISATVLEMTPDGVGVIESGRLLYANPALLGLMGATAGRAPDYPLDPQMKRLVDRACELSSKPPTLRRERVRLEAKGGPLLLEVRVVPIDLVGQRAVAFFVRDVSEEGKAEERLTRADRLASLGQLAAGVAHEINNPLSYVLGSIDLATQALSEMIPSTAAHAELQSDVLQSLRNAREGADRVRVIARDLITFSRPVADNRPAAENWSLVNVESVLDASVNIAWNEIRHRARLVKRYAGVPPIVADEARIGQVFLNLLMNAAHSLDRASDQGGEIVLTTRLEHERVVVEVADTGSGIAAEDLAHVFEPFFTTKPAGMGTGLGLAICQSIVLAHGGQIGAQSSLGRGSQFRVALPRAREGVQLATGPAKAPAPAPACARILVIDDEPLLGHTLSFAFRGKHDVVVAASGRDALNRLATDAMYDLVLCDLMMPDVSGQRVFEAVEKDHPNLVPRFVFMTGGAFTERAQAFLDQHRGRAIEKPFTMADVERLLTEQGS
ncbi:MAG: ATP-binding protein [Myxococcota bacterium]|jgi:two-component system, cell cycle sensor histidine kinase and response regulator CckA|nr:ATP-binding protein [Myxococcota bacterium]